MCPKKSITINTLQPVSKIEDFNTEKIETTSFSIKIRATCIAYNF